MENIVLPKSDLTPAVNFNAETKYMEIEGRCIPEDAHSFFAPLIAWIGNLFENGSGRRDIEYNLSIKCDYFNSATSKMLVYLFDKVAEIQKRGIQFSVTWHCGADDPDLIDSVNDYMSITEATITIKHD